MQRPFRFRLISLLTAMTVTSFVMGMYPILFKIFCLFAASLFGLFAFLLLVQAPVTWILQKTCGGLAHEKDEVAPR